MERYLFWGTFFFAYVVNGVTGFAGNIFAMPVGMNTIGLDTSIVVLNCTGWLASILIAVTGIKKIVWREVLKMCLVMIVFMALGVLINRIASLDFLSKVYGVAILIIAIRGLFFNKNEKDLPSWLLWIILAFAGVIQGMFVSGGSFLAIYALQKIKDKEAFRATTTMTWVILNGAYALFGVVQGGLADGGWFILLVCIPLLIIATWLGGMIQKRISQQRFTKFVYVLLLVVGTVMLFK